MAAWLLTLGFAAAESFTGPATGGPYRVAVGHVSHSGIVTGEQFGTGAKTGCVFCTGQTAGQIDGRCG